MKFVFAIMFLLGCGNRGHVHEYEVIPDTAEAHLLSLQSPRAEKAEPIVCTHNGHMHHGPECVELKLDALRIQLELRQN